MNDASRAREHCRFEDRVIASFVDGEPGEDLPELAAHLDACAICAEAQRQARAVDALLAAQTRTDIDDSVADRLLAGVDRASPSPLPARPGAFSRVRPGWLAAAGVLVAVLVAFLWVSRGSRRGPEAERPPVKPTPPVGSASPGAHDPFRSGASGEDAFPVPRGAAGAAPKRGPSDFTETELLAWLKGDRIPGLTREAVAVRVEAVFASASGRAGPDRELTVEATRWQLACVRRGLMPSGRLRAAGRVLLESRGALRRDLVEVFREHENAVRQLARSRIGRNGFDPVVVGLVGALGFRPLAARVSDRAGLALDLCAGQARHTGDRQCLAFLVELYLGEARKSYQARRDRTTWFEDLASPTDAVLAQVLKHKARQTRSREVREMCEELAERLGLTESCQFWFTRNGVSPPGSGAL